MQFHEAGSDSFRSAMRATAAGVNVITARDTEGTPFGMTATAFSSLSFDPLLVLICIHRDSRTYELVKESGRFGVNILNEASVELSNHYAQPGTDKTVPAEQMSPGAPDDGAPALKGALAYLDCKVTNIHNEGTHAIFIGQIMNVGLSESGKPLVYHSGGYYQLNPIS